MRAFLWMAGSAVLFALMNLFARLASAHAHFTVVGAMRATVGFLVAVAVARARGVSLVVKDRRRMALRSGFGTLAMMATFYTLSRSELPLGDAATLFNLAPLGVALLSPLVLGETIGRRVVFSLVVSLAGVALVLRPSFLFGAGTAQAPGATTAAGFAILAACLSSVAMTMLRRVGQSESAETIAVHFSWFAAAVFWLLSVPTLRAGLGAAFFDATTVGEMVVAGLCAGFAQIAMTRAYGLASAARVSSMGYLNVVASALLGALGTGHIPTLSASFGMLLVVAGGLLVTFGGELRKI